MTTAERFVMDYYGNTSFGEDIIYNLKLAAEDIAYWKADGDDVPDDLTPQILMETWNRLVLHDSRFVEDPDKNYRRFPRWAYMSDAEIAKTIIDADSWDEVDDLVERIDELYLNLERTENGYYADDWDDKVYEWCEKAKAEAN